MFNRLCKSLTGCRAKFPDYKRSVGWWESGQVIMGVVRSGHLVGIIVNLKIVESGDDFEAMKVA
jgi:hypothetical protein